MPSAKKASWVTPIEVDPSQTGEWANKETAMEGSSSVSLLEGATAPALPVPSPIKDKWQGAVTQGSGFVAIPMALLRMQTKYGLSQTEMMVLINLLAHWWEPSRGVFPRSSVIAARLGVAKRTVQRATEKLESMGLIERDIDDKGRRVFAFEGLVARLARDVPVASAVHGEENRGPKRG